MRNCHKAAAMIAAVILSACPALAETPTQPVTMLPPTPIGNAAVCLGGHQLLSYSGASGASVGGQSGINCTPIGTDPQGDLALSGYLMIGDSGLVCDWPHSGAIKFNVATQNFEGCRNNSWQVLGGSPVGRLYWSGAWAGNAYWCDGGYHVVGFHYDSGNTNNATWFECQAN